MRRGDPVAWQPFVVMSLLLAITAGFGLGGLLMAAAVRHAASGSWWEAAAQAHGHIQVFGWAGLMVLGVGLHILPRLRGAPLAHAAWTRPACALLVAGLALRAVGQPALALAHAGTIHTLLDAALVGSGGLELGGVGLLLWMLGCTARSGPPLATRPGLRSVLPFFIVAFGALVLALAVNEVGLVGAIRAGYGLVPDAIDDLTAWIAFYAFLLPVSLAMSARTFPIFLRTALPRLTLLRAALALLLGGVAPVAVPGLLPGASAAAAMAASGLIGLVALALFGLNVVMGRAPAPAVARRGT